MRTLRLLLPLLLAASAAGAADLEVVRGNFFDYYTAAHADRNSSRVRDALSGLEAQARTYLAPELLRGNGSWSDIDYSETPSGSWSPWDHSRRLLVLAKAYRTPGQSLYGDPQLRATIESALAYTRTFYGTTTLPLGNWWFWTIGIPLDLGPTLVLMRGDISQDVFDDCVRAIALRIGSSPTSRGIAGPVPTGQNLVWSSLNHLSLALARGEPNRLMQVRDAIASVTLPSSGEGVKADSSFHQHGAQLYTGAYGGAFANDVARYVLLARGSGYELPPASLQAFANYVVDGIAWSVHGPHFDASVVGREVVRPSTSGYHGIASLLQAAAGSLPREAEIRGAAANMLRTWGGLPLELAGLADQLERQQQSLLIPSGHRHYFHSDYTVHRRGGWFASIKMFSNRTKSGERTNNENLLGARQSDGRLHLVLDGTEYFGRDVWPALDWSRLPGITVEQKADAASGVYGIGSRAFVGGTGDGRNGVSAMDLAPLDSSLTARKAWFFFDDAIVFLANGITSTSPNRVETIVNQWPVVDTHSQPVQGSNWQWFERIGYYFPAGQQPRSTRETRSGTWAALGGSTDASPRSADLWTLWLDHGTMPSNATAAYVIVPNIAADAMRNWAASAPVSILANDGLVSAARDHRTNALGLVFWRPASFGGISSDSPAIVYLVDEGERVHLSTSDPTQGPGAMRITLPGRFAASGFDVTNSATGTTIALPRAEGRTTTVTLTRVTTRRRAAR